MIFFCNWPALGGLLYAAISPTSLLYIVLSTIGFSLWRPDGVMMFDGRAEKGWN
jgi:hypothetical protein